MGQAVESESCFCGDRTAKETELGVGVEGRVAEWSRDAEEGSGARVRRSRCGPETLLAGRSVRHSSLPTPSINNSPHPR